MRLILRAKVDQLGKQGDVVSVAAGYGRNYLLPQGLAYRFSEGNIKRVEKERKLLEVRKIKEQQEAQEFADRIAKVSESVMHSRQARKCDTISSRRPPDRRPCSRSPIR